MIAHAGPDGRIAQRLRIDIEEVRLVLAVEPGAVGIVTEEDHEVGMRAAIPCREGIAHRFRIRIACAAVAQCPEAEWPGWTARGRGDEEVTAIRREIAAAVTDGVVVARSWCEAREAYDVFRGEDGVGGGLVERIRCSSPAHDGIGGDTGAPADCHFRGGRTVEVGTAGEFRINRGEAEVEAEVAARGRILMDFDSDDVFAVDEEIGIE